MSMQHQFLREGERNRRRTIADAIDVLARDAGFGDGDIAEVQVATLQLPSRKTVELLNASFYSQRLGQIANVSLATSSEFTAIHQGEASARRFGTFTLDGAKVDHDGMVRLSNGITLRAVEVLPAKLPLDPSDLDWRIVIHVISIVGAEQRCYPSLREYAQSKGSSIPSEMIPDIKSLDCSALVDLELPPLKYLAQQIGKRDHTLKNLSGQKIANALRDFGMRIPNDRSLRQRPHLATN